MSGSAGLRDESLSPGPTTFTLERIKRQLENDTFLVNPNLPEEGIPPPFKAEDFSYSREGRVHRFYTDLERNERRERFCRGLYEQALNCESHCSRLDDLASQIVLCNFQIESKDDVSDYAYHLLTRLPARPLQLPDVPAALSRDYLVHDSYDEGNPTATATLWHDLQVTSYISANVIRAALLLAIYPYSGRGRLQNFLDTVANLISTASTLSLSADSELARQSWFVLRSFLWASWQRCTMIYFFSFVGKSLRSGFDDHNAHSLVLRGMQISPGLSIHEMLKTYASMHKPQYMCGWAFELLRNNPICIGFDFRRFFFRYSAAFGDRLGRCLRADRASVRAALLYLGRIKGSIGSREVERLVSIYASTRLSMVQTGGPEA